jgi:hypothetical protein
VTASTVTIGLPFYLVVGCLALVGAYHVALWLYDLLTGREVDRLWGEPDE